MQAPRLPALTAVRFLVALWVVLYHARYIYVFPSPLKELVGSGYVGVSIFFILSGFILCYSYLPREVEPTIFWLARFARIWPVYACGLLVTLPIFYETTVARNPSTALTIGIPVVLLAQSWIPHSVLGWNSPGWSLSAEAAFYAIFPFILRPAVGTFRRNFWVACAALWLISMVPMALYIWRAPDGQVSDATHAFWLSLLKYSPPSRLPEVIIGIGLGYL